MPFNGGASALCGGQLALQGTKLQKAKGVPYDPPQSLVHDLIANGHLHNDLNLLLIQAENSPRAVDWALDKYKMQFIEQPLQYRAEFAFDRTLYLKGYCAGMYKGVLQAAKDAGVVIKGNTKAQELIVKNDRVVGVKAAPRNGKPIEIDAKVVLLATGGYGANKDLLVEPLKSALYYGPASSTGDGHMMAEKAGAKLELMQFGKRYPNGVEAAPGKAQTIIQGNYRAWKESGFLVNKDGKRVINEKASNNDIMQVLEKQPGQMLYLVMDEPTFEKFKEGIFTQGVTQEKLDKWLELNGKGAPIFAHGNTLEEAAKNAGVNPENLKASVARYNELVKAGKDEDFGRPVAFMKKTANPDGKFFIVEQRPRFATTMGSVVTDNKLRILNKDTNKPIKGLYAAGEIVNAVHGDDSSPGMNISWGITSGRVAGENIVKELKK
jgi:fumarate reductase flavoprotein subunit